MPLAVISPNWTCKMDGYPPSTTRRGTAGLLCRLLRPWAVWQYPETFTKVFAGACGPQKIIQPSCPIDIHDVIHRGGGEPQL